MVGDRRTGGRAGRGRWLRGGLGREALEGLEDLGSFKAGGGGEGLDAQQGGDGLGTEVDQAQGGEVGFIVEGALRSLQGFQETGGGDVDELDLSGQVGGGELIEELALTRPDEAGVEAVLEGVVIAGLTAALPAVL